jgi:hypothetical protein
VTDAPTPATLDAWLARIAKAKNRADGVAVYREAIAARRTVQAGAWPILNNAIRERWSMAGLIYIKEQAWRI